MRGRAMAMGRGGGAGFTGGEGGGRGWGRAKGGGGGVMIEGPYFGLVVLGVLGTGLVAGVFCAFSTFVMRGLAELPPAQGVAAMNAINVTAVRPPFMAVFAGSAVLCAVIAVVTFVLWP